MPPTEKTPPEMTYRELDAWLRAAGWYTRDDSRGWFLTRRGSTLQTSLDEACKIQRRRDAAAKRKGSRQVDRVALWDAINRYVEACGGDPSARTVSGPRMSAVVDVEKVVYGKVRP